MNRGDVRVEGMSPHRLILDNRAHMEIKGVLDILMVEETELEFETSAGVLNIRGDQLHMNTMTLEKGLLVLAGDIAEIFYEDPGTLKKPKTGLMSKWIKG